MIRLRILLLFIAVITCKSKESGEVQTTLVRSGTFTGELIEEGALGAVNSISINAPVISYRYGGLKITSLAEDGRDRFSRRARSGPQSL